MQKWVLTVVVVKDGHTYEIEEVLEGDIDDCIDAFMYHHHEELEEKGLLERDNVRAELLED